MFTKISHVSDATDYEDGTQIYVIWRKEGLVDSDDQRRQLVIKVQDTQRKHKPANLIFSCPVAVNKPLPINQNSHDLLDF